MFKAFIEMVRESINTRMPTWLFAIACLFIGYTSFIFGVLKSYDCFVMSKCIPGIHNIIDVLR